jgi:hypothetical protein
MVVIAVAMIPQVRRSGLASMRWAAFFIGIAMMILIGLALA